MAERGEELEFVLGPYTVRHGRWGWERTRLVEEGRQEHNYQTFGLEKFDIALAEEIVRLRRLVGEPVTPAAPRQPARGKAAKGPRRGRAAR